MCNREEQKIIIDYFTHYEFGFVGYNNDKYTPLNWKYDEDNNLLNKYGVDYNSFIAKWPEHENLNQPYPYIGGLIPKNIVVIDIDNHKREDSGTKEYKRLIETFGLTDLFQLNTVRVMSGNAGAHLYFTLPENNEIKSFNLTDEIEVKTSPSQITLPTADYDLITENGLSKASETIHDYTILPLPIDWLEYIENYLRNDIGYKSYYINKQDNKPKDDVEYEFVTDEYELCERAISKAIEKVGNNSRNELAWKYAQIVNSYGVSQDTAIQYGSHNIIGNKGEQSVKDTIATIRNWYQNNRNVHGKFRPYRKAKIHRDTKKVKPTKSIFANPDYILREDEYITEEIVRNVYKEKYNTSFDNAVKVLIVSQPGSGKTTYAFDSDKGKDIEKIVSFPKLSLGYQKCKEDNITFVNSQNKRDYGVPIQGTTYEQLFQFVEDDYEKNNNKEKHLYLDEFHTLLDAYDYRGYKMKKVLDYIEKFDKVIGMTATPHLNTSLFKDWEVLIIGKENEAPIHAKDVLISDSTNKDDAIQRLVVNGKTNFVHIDSKEKCDTLADVYKARNYKTISLHRLNRDEKDGRHIVDKKKLLKQYDIVFTTSYYAEGIDLYDVNLGSIILYQNGINRTPVNAVKQFINRFRDTKPENLYFLRNQPKKESAIENENKQLVWDYDEQWNNIYNRALDVIQAWKNDSRELFTKTNFWLSAFGNENSPLGLVKKDKDGLAVDEYGVEATVLDTFRTYCNINSRFYYEQLKTLDIVVDYENSLILDEVEQVIPKEEKKEIQRTIRERKKEKFNHELDTYFNSVLEDKAEKQETENDIDTLWKSVKHNIIKEDKELYSLFELVPELKEFIADQNPFHIIDYIVYSVLKTTGGRKEHIRTFYNMIYPIRYQQMMKDNLIDKYHYSNLINRMLLMNIPKEPLTSDEMQDIVKDILRRSPKDKAVIGLVGYRSVNDLSKKTVRKILNLFFTIEPINVREGNKFVTKYKFIDKKPILRYFRPLTEEVW